MPKTTADKTTCNAYTLVQAEIDSALTSQDTRVILAACQRAQLALARAATGPDFDMRRHRAIATALRELSRAPGMTPAPSATRGVAR